MRHLAFILALLLAMPASAGRSFNGSSDKIVAPGAPNITSGPETISFWVYPTAIPSTSEHDMVSQYNYPTGGEFSLGFGVNGGIASASNQFGFLFGCCGAFGDAYGSCGMAGAPTANTWYQVVGFVDTAGTLHGTPTAGMTVSGGLYCTVYTAFSSGRGSGGYFQIASADGNGNFFQGIVGEVARWNSLLSVNQMAALAHICPVGPSARRMGLPPAAPYLPLWGASGTSVEPDFSGHAYNGALTGTVQANHPPCTP